MKAVKKGIRYCIIAGLAGIAVLLAINGFVVLSAEKQIVTIEELQESGAQADAVVILGAQVRPDGTPSKMLKERLDTGISAYEAGLAERIIVSGDHGQDNYDEVNAMKDYAVDRGVPSEHIFMDHAGFSTYESMYRAKAVFQAENIIVITQKYHLYRAVYDAEAMGLQVKGIACDTAVYAGDKYRKLREAAARVKDVGFSIFKPSPACLGEVIPVSGDGNVTNDAAFD